MKKILILLFVLCSARGFSQVVALTGKTQAAGVNYTHTTASSGDWGSVANDTYFYDLTDELAHYKDGSGTVLEVFAAGGDNMANADLTLTADRSHNLGGYNLAFKGGTAQISNSGVSGLSNTGLFIRRNTGGAGVASYPMDIRSGFYGDYLFRITDNNSPSAPYGVFWFGGVMQKTSGTAHQIDLGGYGLGATYGTGAGCMVLKNSGAGTSSGAGGLSLVAEDRIQFRTGPSSLIRAEIGGSNGMIWVQGSGNTSGTTSLLVENLAGDDLFNMQDDGTFALGISAFSSDVNSVSIGRLAGANQTSGAQNTYVGAVTGGGSLASVGAQFNTAVGSTSMYKIYSGKYNSAVGVESSFELSTGQYNVSIGYQAGYENIGGSDNVNVGYQAGFKQTSNNDNTNIGDHAGRENVTGSGNVCIGHDAGWWNLSSNQLFIDNASRTDEADAKVKAMIHGEFATAVANQNLRLNANVGINVAPVTTTFLGVAAGTTAKSQINLKASTAPSSPVDGDIWFDGTDLFIRVSGTTFTLTKT